VFRDTEPFLCLGEDSFDFPKAEVEDKEPSAKVGEDQVGNSEAARDE